MIAHVFICLAVSEIFSYSVESKVFLGERQIVLFENAKISVKKGDNIIINHKQLEVNERLRREATFNYPESFYGLQLNIHYFDKILKITHNINGETIVKAVGECKSRLQ